MFMIKERAKCGVIWSTVKLPTFVTSCPFLRPPDRDSLNCSWWHSYVCTSENLTTSMKVFIALKIFISNFLGLKIFGYRILKIVIFFSSEIFSLKNLSYQDYIYSGLFYPINSKITRGLNLFFLPKIADYDRVRIKIECGLYLKKKIF